MWYNGLRWTQTDSPEGQRSRQMRLNSKTQAYVNEYRERIDVIPEGATLLVDQRSYGVGPVYYTIGQDIYIADYTGSDVDEWAILYYSLVSCDDEMFENDDTPFNRDIIAMLTAPRSTRQQPTLTLCDCGHYTDLPMSASLGTSCPDCYDRMSN